MTSYVFGVWYGFGELTVPGLAGVESAALVVLAASLLVFRTFRERYLLIWILGWLAYSVSNWTLHGAPQGSNPVYLVAIAHAQFVLAVSLFAGAVFVYSHARRLLLPLLAMSVLVMAYAVARAFWWPESFPLRVALEVSYRIIALTAAIQLIRFRWARWEIGPWLLSVSLLALHLDWPPLDAYLPLGFNVLAGLMLGVSTFLVVFDDSKQRTRRLGVINALTTSITRRGSRLRPACANSRPKRFTRPCWTRSEPQNWRMSVVLPAPSAPTRANSSRSLTSRETPCRTSASP